jgi:prolyl-tRNA synthetase
VRGGLIRVREFSTKDSYRLDADLLGLPIGLTIGPRSLKQGSVGLKFRTAKDACSIPLDAVIPTLQTEIEHLLKASKDRTIAMPLPKP